MSNGTICCALEVCCPPPPEGLNEPQTAALAELIAVNGGGAGAVNRMSSPRHIAEVILANFDLVPKGVGRAIVEAYRPEFEKAARKGGAGEASPNAGPEGA